MGRFGNENLCLKDRRWNMSKPQDAPKLLMPKATAVWFIDNTALDFEQIADFTGLHTIEVQALADEEVGRGIVGRDPVKNNELEQTELDKGLPMRPTA